MLLAVTHPLTALLATPQVLLSLPEKEIFKSEIKDN